MHYDFLGKTAAELRAVDRFWIWVLLLVWGSLQLVLLWIGFGLEESATVGDCIGGLLIVVVVFGSRLGHVFLRNFVLSENCIIGLDDIIATF